MDDTKSIIAEITSLDTTVGSYDSISLIDIQGKCSGNLFTYINTLPVESLCAAEISSLTNMREEELLAQDVYIMLYSIYKIPVLNNISKAETQHETAVQTLLLKPKLRIKSKNWIRKLSVSLIIQ